MSIAGIRSNRGDVYQTLVAFDWALTVLSDQDFQWLEIDSINYSVDDVVVGKADDTQIACQCKKNQTDFKAWSIADLADELDKACELLARNQRVKVRFYSRNNFGDLAKLKEHSATQYDNDSYQKSLGKEQRTIDEALSTRLAIYAPNISSFEFLCRTSFVTSDDLDRMVELLNERLRNMVSNPSAAFVALWARLDQLGARMGGNNKSSTIQHRLTKGDLKNILQQAGATLVPLMDLDEVRRSFSSTSAIGRWWQRDIAGQRLYSPILGELLVSINAKKKSILLTGLPGSGKTCVMLALQEELEKRAETDPSIVSLFIQSREFADLAASEDRQAQGLSEQWVEKIARLAENTHVIVVIDSLDVLSIARDHRVLQYFLAQIDRLLLIPDVTVVTACREFDRYYDRRIAERQWDCELKCQPLDWEAEIAPLLATLGVSTSNIDGFTRALISNPRELALFVELALVDDSFNFVTSQALAQRYLDSIVRANDALGDVAIQAIEGIASEMLKLRSLAVPHQRFTASQEIQRKLCSLNVLQRTQDGKIIFGHQTLLDVLVISGAIRSGITLNEFICRLPPVPFVRPSIRSFVAQLVLGERREFRKQIRTVLTGSAAFHIKRLVAEAFAGQIPQDEDWPLIRDLRERNYDVFQVIYIQASSVDWHRFWLTNLVPALKVTQDAEGIMAHVHRIAQWSNVDCAGVVSFWAEALSLDWLENNRVVERLGIYLSDIKPEHMVLVAPLLARLLAMPQAEHSFLGRVVSSCVRAEVVDDSLLWRYILNGITDEDILQFRFDNKLRCQPHEFSDLDEKIINERMRQSCSFLDLSLESIEYWSNARAARYGGTSESYRHGFLGQTSFQGAHGERDLNHTDNLDLLLSAIEEAVLYHAKINSEWWQKKRELLCFNCEGALLYFAIIACTASPELNIDIIGRMLCEKDMLEFELSYELGALIKTAFILLETPVQDAVMEAILTIGDKRSSGEAIHWIRRAQVNLIAPIPCYLRSTKVQLIVDLYEEEMGSLTRQPYSHFGVGVVRAPFSYDVFLQISDGGILRLLAHYSGYSHRADSFDFLIGGEREVGYELQEASSRHPSKFLGLLFFHWKDVPENFRYDIMEGVAKYLAYRYGNLRANETWKPLEEPQADLLANQILTELERHPAEWQHKKCTAEALQACANVVKDAREADRIIFLAEDFLTLNEDDPIQGDSISFLDLGINMAKGNVADALMVLANNFGEQGREFPSLLVPTLRNFSKDKHPAIRAMILRRLPYLQSKSFDLGWELFYLAMQDANGLWDDAEPCLYFAYHRNFETVRPLLWRLRTEGRGKDLEAWGRISALATMAKHIELPEFITSLSMLDSADAWRGASIVWTNVGNVRRHREQCLVGMSSGLNTCNSHALEVAEKMARFFDDKSGDISIPTELIERFFLVLESDKGSENRHHGLFGFTEWININVQYNLEQALDIIEIYIRYIRNKGQYFYDYKNSIAQLMTRLFAEAEEREESDHGLMLHRVVLVQDSLLAMGVNSMVDWLKAAERP